MAANEPPAFITKMPGKLLYGFWTGLLAKNIEALQKRRVNFISGSIFCNRGALNLSL